MANKFTIEQKEELLEAKDYRQFISTVMRLKSTPQKLFGHADLARKSGFASRSFPREVLLGKKHLTLDSMYKMTKGLGLTKDLSQYFTYLVELEVENCRQNEKSDQEIQKGLRNLKSRILDKARSALTEPSKPFSNIFIPRIYAALGTAEYGSSLKEIVARTSLPQEKVLACLVLMEEMGITSRKGIRYYPNISHPSLQNLGHESAFRPYLKAHLQEIIENFDENYSKQHCLFFNSCFCISKEKEVQLKEELRELLLKYVDENDVPVGERVVSLTCTLV